MDGIAGWAELDLPTPEEPGIGANKGALARLRDARTERLGVAGWLGAGSDHTTRVSSLACLRSGVMVAGSAGGGAGMVVSDSTSSLVRAAAEGRSAATEPNLIHGLAQTPTISPTTPNKTAKSGVR